MKHKELLKELFSITSSSSRKHIWVVVLDCFLNAIIPVLWSVIPALIIDIWLKKESKCALILFISLIVSCFIIHVASLFLKRHIEIGNQKIKNTIRNMLCEKILFIPFCETETFEVMEHKDNAAWVFDNYGGITYLVKYLVESFLNLFELFIYIIIIFRCSFLMGIVMIICCLPIIRFIKSEDAIETEYWDDVTSKNRRFLYLTWNIAHNYKFGKDIRLYNARPLISGKFDHLRENWRDTEERYTRKKGRISFFLELLSIVMLALSIIICFLTIKSISIKVLCISVVVQISGTIERFKSGVVDFRRLVAFAQYFISFIHRKDDEPIASNEDAKGLIEFNNVSFMYPTESTEALHNISFKAHKGETCAIVGRNGSGKTTIVKLLCGLYKPLDGEIKISNNIGVVFQDYKIFPLSIKDNVLFGRNNDDKRISSILREQKLEIKTNELSNGIDTNIGKSLDDGIELSGGQAQHLAIARALYTETDVLVLDEPNAELDPKAEQELYLSLENYKKDKVILFVSHRMAACKFCDRIIVIKDGKIIESGTHKELMRRRGEYYLLFSTQKKLYE